MKVPLYAIAVAAICIPVNARSQTTLPKFEAGTRISALAYQGDLSPSIIGSYKTPTTGFGVFVSRNLDNALSVRVNLDYGKIKGNDALYSNPSWKQQRNFSFKATTLEASAHIIYNLKSSYSGYGFHPYVFGGAGLSLLNIKRDYSQFNYAFSDWQSWVAPGLATDIDHTPPKVAMVFPVGAGFKHPLSYNFILFGEASYRFTFTDYIDGFSRSANAKNKDHYSNISIGLIYRFGNTAIDCPRY